jgi:hypothetical protein
MPYIPHDRRGSALLDSPAFASVGDLNYIITHTLVRYLGRNPGYASINEAIGVLECAKLELYRRVAAPYEDRKCAENGDVY